MVVDEAVLALTGYRLPDPLDVFYARRGGRRLGLPAPRRTCCSARPDELAPPRAGGRSEQAVAGWRASRRWRPRRCRRWPRRADDARARRWRPRTRPPSRSARAPTSRRSRSSPRACPPTPRAGRSVPVKLPDNLTRYRVMAVAVAGARQLRLGRGDAHRAPAADGAPVAAALPELRRPLRAAGRGAEPDRRAR